MTTEMLRIVRIGAYAAIAAIALIWAAVGAGFFQREEGASFGRAAIGSFRLTDQDGTMVTEKSLAGRPALIFFGFTNCPDVCPTTLTSMTGLLARLGSDGDRVGATFVTVDPARDTAGVLKAYLASFDPRIRGLTGADDQIAAIAKPLGVFYVRVGEGDSYSMDHSASVFLVGADGTLRGTIAYGEDAATAEAKVRALLR